jgi:hypothetical protein
MIGLPVLLICMGAGQVGKSMDEAATRTIGKDLGFGRAA